MKRGWGIKSAVILATLLLTHQNCGSVKLQKLQTVPEHLASTSIPEGSFCSKPTGINTGIVKVIFILDMSFSNIGSWTYPGGQPFYDKNSATDLTGQRFVAVQDFINTCGASNPQNKFAIAAFSGQNFPSSGCPTTFKPSANALADLNNWKTLQTNTITQAEAFSANPSSNYNSSMDKTNYQSSFACAKNLVDAEIARDPVQAKVTDFLVLFLTDGKPTDNCDTSTLPANGSCPTNTGPGPNGSYIFNPGYVPTITDMTINGKMGASDLRFQPIFYGSATEATAARPILDELARAGDAESAILLNNVSQLNLCQLAQSPTKIQYKMTGFNVVNLTALMRKGRVIPDSDMDGVPDEKDGSPDNPRSQGNFLDGICENMGGSNCMATSCDPTRFTGTHLSECDIAAAGLIDGSDTDDDTMPDLVELLRESDPLRYDIYSNLDRDSLTNLQEIALGREANWPDDDVAPEYLVDVTVKSAPPNETCGPNQSHYNFTINHMPLVSTVAYSDPQDANTSLPEAFKLSHADDENLILIYYTVEPVNAPPLTAELWGRTLRIPRIGAKIPPLRPTDFQKLGVINGRHPW